MRGRWWECLGKSSLTSIYLGFIPPQSPGEVRSKGRASSHVFRAYPNICGSYKHVIGLPESPTGELLLTSPQHFVAQLFRIFYNSYLCVVKIRYELFFIQLQSYPGIRYIVFKFSATYEMNDQRRIYYWFRLGMSRWAKYETSSSNTVSSRVRLWHLGYPIKPV